MSHRILFTHHPLPSVDLLKKLVLPDGSILRAKNPGRPTRDCLFVDVGQDGRSALKIWNSNDRKAKTKGQTDGGVVGVFNVQGVAWNFDSHANEVVESSPPPVTAQVKPYDVETMRTQSGPFAVWSHRTGKMNVLPNGDSSIEAKLDPHEWEVFTMEPIQTGEFVQWAPIGLGDMINSGGAILHTGLLDEAVITTNSTFGEDASDGRLRHTTTAEVSSRGSGRFVAYCEPAPSRIIVDSGSTLRASQLDFSHDPASGMLEFILPEEVDRTAPHHISVVWDRRI